MNRVFEQNIVKKMDGEPENELANNATIRFELHNVKYEVHINEEDELEIYKTSLNTSQTDTIRIKPKSSNVVTIN